MECTCYHVYCTWHSLFVYTLSASAFIKLHVSLNQLDFFLEIFLWRLLLFFFDMRYGIINFSSTFLAQACIKWNLLIFLVSVLLKTFSRKFVTQCCPRNRSWCIIIACVPTNGIQQLEYTLPLQSFSQKSAVLVTLKTKLKRTIPGEFSDCRWLFQMLHVSCHSDRLAEERRRRKKEEDEQFWHLTVSGLPL